jgi:hypothetical protein
MGGTYGGVLARQLWRLLRWAVVAAGLFSAGNAFAAVWVVSPLGAPLSLDQALKQAQDGDTIELFPGEYKSAVASIDNRRLTIKGVGKRPVIQAQGKLTGTRALWTVRGGQVTLENLEFRGTRASDGEGAALRQEGGLLTVRRCAFYDNEYGLLAINNARAELSIEDSEFGLAPKVVGARLHLLNVGRIAKLSVKGSRFQQGFEGQLLKTRARENIITYNFIHDGARGGASYEIEIANGGLATIIGNVIGQGSDTQNPVLVAYATESGVGWDKNALYMAHNTLVNYAWTPAWFVRVIHKNLPADTEVVVINNLMLGSGLLWPAVTGRVEGNRHVTRGMLRDVSTYAFELQPASIWRNSGVDPRNVSGQNLSPTGEFEWPVGVVPLAPVEGPRTPGAYQR